MADKQEFEIDGKQISQLRVVDLKQELEKRGLSKSGSKKDLLDRLKRQLQLETLQQTTFQDEGHVPNLGLQDDAIAEQSDVIKEYLAKQQEIFEMQKAARRRVEMEEELKGQMSEADSATTPNIITTTTTAEQESPLASESPTTPVISTEEKQITSVSVKDDDSIDMKKDISDSSESRETVSNTHTQEPSDTMTSETAKPEEIHSKAEEVEDDNRKHINKENVQISSSVSEENQKLSDSQKEEKIPVESSSSNLQASDSLTNDSVNATNLQVNSDDKSDNKEVKTFRRRIKREFFQAEGPKEVATPTTSTQKTSETLASEKLISGDSEKLQQNTEISQGSWAEEETDNSNLSRERPRQRQSPTEEHSQDHQIPRSRSNSSNSSSSATRETPKRKDSSRASSSSGSSSDENSKSPRRLHQESNSASSSESPEKRHKYSPVVYSEKSVSPKSKTSGNDIQNSSQDDKKDTKKDESPSDSKIAELNTPSVLQLGETTNDESMDIENKPEEEAVDRQESENGKDEENKTAGRVHVRKISLSSAKEGPNKENLDSSADGEKPVRKRKWGSTSTKGLKKTTFTISTDSLKTLIPDVKPITTAVTADALLDVADATSEQDDQQDPSTSKDLRILRTVTQIVPENADQDVVEMEQAKHEVKTMYTKPLYLMEEPIGRHRSPSPARNPASHIIHIRNLVRPFTLNQLKDLLARTGKLIEGGFWIDKIKSKCYATYENIEQAVATRQALHGTQWPPSNRKNLIVDFADEDELHFHMSLTDPVEVPKPEKYMEPLPKEIHKRLREPVPAHSFKTKESEPPLPPPIREWDREKIGEHSPGERERRKQTITPPREKRRERNRELREKREKKEKRKEEDEAPAKLLDDLFKKTKITPCIYWLPLTAEQIKQKEEERKQRQLEREKRRQLLKKEELEKNKPNTSREVKKAKVEDGTHHRKRSSAPSHSRNRKR